MADLVAQGNNPNERWARTLPVNQLLTLGRDCGVWSVPWDQWISQRHAELQWANDVLVVRQTSSARNPIFFQGKEAVNFTVRPGQGFVIGRTLFTLEEATQTCAPSSPEVFQSRTISANELKKIPFRDAPHRLDVLSRLPDAIASAANEADLFVHLGNMLLAGMPRADAACLLAIDGKAAEAPPRILHQEIRRLVRGEFRPSARLVREALRQQGQSVLHVWKGNAPKPDQQFTMSGDLDWAFCTPIDGDACKGWGIYVSGRFATEGDRGSAGTWHSTDLEEDMKFTELVASIFGSLRQVQSLQHKQTVLSSFFSPGVLHVLTEGNPEEELKPREVEVTVLFCDLRGFSGQVEKAATNLFSVLERVSQALGVMTGKILEQDGVIADFQGDSAMSFWGWPIAGKDKVQQACLAALAIRKAFRDFAGLPDHPLADFRAGIGIATGIAVAGSIGPRDQAKVSVFGPVVNLSARLQGMTKMFRVPILINPRTAEILQQTTPTSLARSRRLAQVKPYGLSNPVMVHELLPPAADFPELTDEHLASYDAALNAFLNKDWPGAYKLLHRVPPEDLGKDFVTGYIIQHQHTPPANWNAVIELTEK